MRHILFLLLALSVSFLKGQTEDTILGQPADLIGQALPGFSDTSLTGKIWNAETLKGKVVMINFWYIGCLPCMKEISYLNNLHEKYKDQDFVLLSIAPHVREDALSFNSDSTTNYSTIRRYLAQAKIEYEIIAACDERTVTKDGKVGPDCSAIASLFNVRAYPTTFIIGKDGIIKHAQSGFVVNRSNPQEGVAYDPGYSEWIDQLLAQDSH